MSILKENMKSEKQRLHLQKFKGKKRSPESVLKGAQARRRGSFFNCLQCDSKFWRQPSAIKKGDCKFCSKNCYFHWQKGKPKVSGFVLRPMHGKNNPNWRGGITPAHTAFRNSKIYKRWRDLIFARDGYTCQECFAKSKKGCSVYLEAHHIKPFATHPQLRLEISNGITLCKKCHSHKPKGKEIHGRNHAA